MLMSERNKLQKGMVPRCSVGIQGNDLLRVIFSVSNDEFIAPNMGICHVYYTKMVCLSDNFFSQGGLKMAQTKVTKLKGNT